MKPYTSWNWTDPKDREGSGGHSGYRPPIAVCRDCGYHAFFTDHIHEHHCETPDGTLSRPSAAAHEAAHAADQTGAPAEDHTVHDPDFAV